MGLKGWDLGLVVPLQDPTPFSPFIPTEWQDALRQVAEFGYEGVELAITDPTLLDLRGIAGVVQREGLRVLAIATGQTTWVNGLSICASEDKSREKAIQRMGAYVRFAKHFEAVVIVGSIRGANKDANLLVTSLRECTSFDPSVRITLEPLNRYESSLVNTVREALEIIERVGAENLGIHIDTFHANIEEANIREAFRAAQEKLFHVDLADSNRWVPGYGHLAFNEVWQALAEINYKGHLVIECLPYPSAEAVLCTAERIRLQWGR